MEHAEFVRKYNKGMLIVSVNRTLALQAMQTKMVPGRYRAAHLFWSWIWLLSIPVAIVVMIFYEFWVGLLILLILTPALAKATKRSAFQFMIEIAVDDPEFYKFAVDNSIFVIEEKT